MKTIKTFKKNTGRLTPAEAIDREDSLRVLSLMRRKKYSLAKASRTEGLSQRKALKYVRKGLKKKGRRWKAKRWDVILREMNFYWRGRNLILIIRDSRHATTIGRYNSAVRVFLETGNVKVLKPFKKKKIRDIRGKRYEFVTDPEKIFEIAERREDEEYYTIYSD